MSLHDLAERLRRLGFFCTLDDFDADGMRVIVMKLRSTPGNRLAGHESTLNFLEDTGMVTHELDEPCPEIWHRNGRYEFTVVAAVPTSAGAYQKFVGSVEEVYEEVLHYFFDADSRMRLEADFVAGPGRPQDA